jgi:hypothetical protein
MPAHLKSRFLDQYTARLIAAIDIIALVFTRLQWKVQIKSLAHVVGGFPVLGLIMDPAAIATGQYWQRKSGPVQVETRPTEGVKNSFVYSGVFATMIGFHMGPARPVATTETILAKSRTLFAGAVDRFKADRKIGCEIIQCGKGVCIDET